MERPDPQTIPPVPGVYLYRDAAGTVLYVGKARVLRRRVLSYFRPDGVPVKTAAMLSHAASIEYLTTTTDKEAFLLEASLIKKYRPHYNILLRDDKQYALFRLDVKAEYPRLEIVRHARRDGARYFGPFTSALAARETWKLLHRAFPLRRCTDKAMRNRVRPCLYHHMGQCLAPCMGDVPAQEYREHVDHVCLVLSGRAGDFVEELRKRMLEAAEELEFEKAARIRDQIQAVERTVEQQSVVLPQGGDMDVLGLYAAEQGLALGVLFVRAGAVLDGRSFFWSGLDFGDATEAMVSFLAQFYMEMTPPPRILLPWLPRDREEDAESEKESEEGSGEGHAERDILEQSLAERRGGPVRLVAPQNAADNRLVDIAQSNAREEALRRSRAQASGPLPAVAKLLRLPAPPSRLECVDVSHTGGRQTRVGMVVYTDGQADRREWRTYAMPDSGDDYATLYAWVARRLESGPPWPDLLLIDGGRGQVACVDRALRDAGQGGLFPIAGIAKARDEDGHADRRAGNVADRIFVPGRSNPLPFREGSPELLFLQSVRDSTHHFAITRHRRARTREAMAGELMRLPGIGAATARLLWDRFGSFEAMQQAAPADIAAIDGIGPARAAKIAACLHSLTGTGPGQAAEPRRAAAAKAAEGAETPAKGRAARTGRKKTAAAKKSGEN
ncbi:MAG: excinuclease ABC subunit UvrC [Desulfovibrionaceae bacterium]|nr:excinuclease ABC subunit UvrC [Desulfovibrionaceae bacterium]